MSDNHHTERRWRVGSIICTWFRRRLGCALTRVPDMLGEARREILALDPDGQTVEYDLAAWLQKFRTDPDFMHVCRLFPGAITRSNVIDMGRQARENLCGENLRRYFFAVMMWGFGTVGYGPYRMRQMVDSPEFDGRMRSAIEQVTAGDLERAFAEFRLPCCGEVYATKYLYFIGRVWDVYPLPVVLDSRVIRSFDRIDRPRLERYAKLHRKNGKVFHFIFSEGGYARYVDDLNCWARKLDCRADQIEYYLFRS